MFKFPRVIIIHKTGNWLLFYSSSQQFSCSPPTCRWDFFSQVSRLPETTTRTNIPRYSSQSKLRSSVLLRPLSQAPTYPPTHDDLTRLLSSLSTANCSSALRGAVPITTPPYLYLQNLPRYNKSLPQPASYDWDQSAQVATRPAESDPRSKIEFWLPTLRWKAAGHVWSGFSRVSVFVSSHALGCRCQVEVCRCECLCTVRGWPFPVSPYGEMVVIEALDLIYEPATVLERSFVKKSCTFRRLADGGPKGCSRRLHV